jgi:hypothetical protein
VFLENVGPIAINVMARQWKEKAVAAAKRREAAAAEPQLPLAEPVPPTPAEGQEIVSTPPDAEQALQAGDGEAMPPRHQRASFAERVRNWLGSA